MVVQAIAGPRGRPVLTCIPSWAHRAIESRPCRDEETCISAVFFWLSRYYVARHACNKRGWETRTANVSRGMTKGETDVID